MSAKKKKNGPGKWLPILCVAAVLCIAAVLVGKIMKNRELTGNSSAPGMETMTDTARETAEGGAQEITDSALENAEGIARETAADGQIDFDALREENPDIFAWLYIPGTDIDYPVLQSEEADDFYEFHDAFGSESTEGALYTELANMKDMCDFNTVIHGKTLDSGKQFTGLHLFADKAYFDGHEQLYIYLPDNVLTYEIFASYPREDTSLIREYDFTYTKGCDQFLKDMYAVREMGKNIREGWDELTARNFLVTLTTDSLNDAGRQYIVIAALTNDAAGKIDRTLYE